MPVVGDADADLGVAVPPERGSAHPARRPPAWEGQGAGIYSTERGDIVTAWFRGTGADEGLSYFMLADSIDVSGGVTSHYRVRRQIFPGDPPKLSIP